MAASMPSQGMRSLGSGGVLYAAAAGGVTMVKCLANVHAQHSKETDGIRSLSLSIARHTSPPQCCVGWGRH